MLYHLDTSRELIILWALVFLGANFYYLLDTSAVDDWAGLRSASI